MKFEIPILFFVINSLAHAQQASTSKPIAIPERPKCEIGERERIQLRRAIQVGDSLSRFQNAAQQTSIQKFGWPLKWIHQRPGNSFYSFSNYVDQDLSNGIRDFNCGSRTYNQHKGTDIYPWPGWWQMMDREEVDIVAAARGVIISKTDGNYDQNCTFAHQAWNSVYLQHAEGLITWYGHMKKNTLTTKSIGDTVAEGEYLGKVGSSGISTGPHLHFEVYKTGVLQDPYTGGCNSSQTSLWKNQHPYYNQALIRSFCCSGEPSFPPCPQRENLKKDSIFSATDTVFLSNYYRDLKSGDTTVLLLYNPLGQRIDSQFTIHDLSPDRFHDAGGWIWKKFLEPAAMSGNYRFESRYRGNTLSAEFVFEGISTATKIRLQKHIIYQIGNEIEIHGLDQNKEIVIFDLYGRVQKNTTIWQDGILKFTLSGKGYYWIRSDKGFIVPISNF